MTAGNISGRRAGRMRRWLSVLAVGALGAGVSLAADPAPERGDSQTAATLADTNSTVITSTRLTFDQQKRTAIFEDQVVVVDPQVKITADKLTVFFSEDNKVTVIEAQGTVVIQQEEKKAMGEKARYEVNEGKFVLSGHPWVVNGRDTLSADMITFWRNSNRILCEPNARLVIRSDHESFQGGFIKE